MIRISVYEWMKINESRYAKKKKKKAKSKNQKIIHLKTTQDNGSLDSFVENSPQDNIFDSEFSKEDFLKLTKKWKDAHLEE
jgi:hypothetical protein